MFIYNLLCTKSYQWTEKCRIVPLERNSSLYINNTGLSFLILAGRFYYKNYEEDIPGRVSGQRVSDVEPLCGRYSLKNPSILWKAGYSSFTEDILYNPYKIYKYKWVSTTNNQI